MRQAWAVFACDFFVRLSLKWMTVKSGTMMGPLQLVTFGSVLISILIHPLIAFSKPCGRKFALMAFTKIVFENS